MDAVALEPTLKSLERQFCNPQTWVKYLLEDDEVRAQVAVSYYNDSGNPAIGKKVLSAFKKLTGDSVIWERGERMWRFREKHDEPGRQQY